MSYCRYKAFKVLAKNYLGIDTHSLFQEIQPLLEEVNMSPCDVAENLIVKNTSGGTEICLNNLIHPLKEAKEKAIKDAKEAKEKSKKHKNLTKLVRSRLKKLFR
ncbi:hypothetical protein T459_06930 [Capsicum annuum]|uniref:AAA+ ATPase At3g28540-like C-terminal domain-containing protein n=1 Tax=Capsicum annuum TaxID=4072 RepID=A0A2G3AC57_CAPAN|nr:hypothetical protein T459_06930 [Capsicum annuum]